MQLQRRPLGRTGMCVSEIGLGTWALGSLGRHEGAWNYGYIPEHVTREVLETYVEAGGNHIDSAHNYHDAEQRIGAFLRTYGKRDELIITSKVWQTDETTVRQKLEETLRWLGTDYIDIYYMHNPPDDPGEMERVLDLYDTLREEGKIRAIGATLKGHNVRDETVDLIRQYVRSGRVDVVMCICSVLRQKNIVTFAEAAERGVGIVLRTVLESGFLTGKYKPGHRFTQEQDHRRRWPEERLDQILALIQDFSAQTVNPPWDSPAKVAIRFALDLP
ncbi:MAG: aldo/keto reductase, partial [Lentisphaerae bacterium]